MVDTVLVALIAGGSAIVAAAVTALVAAWLGGRKATNEDARLGLDALVEGLEAAKATTESLNEKLSSAERRIERIERQAYRVLSENNRFRIIHGEEPALSLESFEPLADEKFANLLARLDKRYERS